MFLKQFSACCSVHTSYTLGTCTEIFATRVVFGLFVVLLSLRGWKIYVSLTFAPVKTELFFTFPFNVPWSEFVFQRQVKRMNYLTIFHPFKCMHHIWSCCSNKWQLTYSPSCFTQFAAHCKHDNRAFMFMKFGENAFSSQFPNLDCFLLFFFIELVFTISFDQWKFYSRQHFISRRIKKSNRFPCFNVLLLFWICDYWQFANAKILRLCFLLKFPFRHIVQMFENAMFQLQLLLHNNVDGLKLSVLLLNVCCFCYTQHTSISFVHSAISPMNVRNTNLG